MDEVNTVAGSHVLSLPSDAVFSSNGLVFSTGNTVFATGGKIVFDIQLKNI